MTRKLEYYQSPKYPQEVLSKALDLKSMGLKWETIAKRLGVGSDGLKRRLDPEYRHRRNLQIQEAQFRRDNGETRMYNIASRVPMSEIYRLLDTVPADTRSLTGRACGDPLPGRSALDKYRANPCEKVRRERTAFEFSPLSTQLTDWG